MMKVLGVTLARGGSKGIPRKNIIDINGRPLIDYTIKEALKSKYINRYIVSTDDEEIANVAKELGAEVPFMRPKELASDEATSAEALRHATLEMENMVGYKFDYVVELMVTNPFKRSTDIDGAIEKLNSTGADSVIGMCKLEDHHPARIKKIEDDYIRDFCVPELSSRRQDLKPEAYIRNGSIYALRRDRLIMDRYRFGGNNSKPYLMREECLVNIDTMLDVRVAKALLTE